MSAWIQAWNDDPKPYVWTKTAEEILDSIAHYCRAWCQPRKPNVLPEQI